MPNKTRRATSRRSSTRKGGVLKKLAAATLAATAAASAGPQTKMTGPAPYAMGAPAFPSRNGRLNVLPSPTPAPMKWESVSNHASRPVWPTPTPRPNGSKAEFGYFEPKPGTRWVAPPEVQTWNPYLRGDPNELVDYYDGLTKSYADKLKKEQGEKGKVPRKETPAWRAAEFISVDLPDRTTSESNKMKNDRWAYWSQRGRNMGLNIPRFDPRTSLTMNEGWQNVPDRVNNKVLSKQLYYAEKAPGSAWGNGWAGEYGQYGQMRGNAPVPNFLKEGRNAATRRMYKLNKNNKAKSRNRNNNNNA